MYDLLNSISLTGIAASLAKAISIPPPSDSAPSIEAINRLIQTNTANGKVDRVKLKELAGLH